MLDDVWGELEPTVRDWLNIMAGQELTEAEVRRIAQDPQCPWPKRAAAERILRTLEAGDLADLEPWLLGKASLEELRARGVNTEVIKKAKETKRVVGRTEDGQETTIITREIELHDRAGADFDRIMDRTEGRPVQQHDVVADIPARVTIVTPLTLTPEHRAINCPTRVRDPSGSMS